MLRLLRFSSLALVCRLSLIRRREQCECSSSRAATAKGFSPGSLLVRRLCSLTHPRLSVCCCRCVMAVRVERDQSPVLRTSSAAPWSQHRPRSDPLSRLQPLLRVRVRRPVSHSHAFASNCSPSHLVNATLHRCYVNRRRQSQRLQSATRHRWRRLRPALPLIRRRRRAMPNRPQHSSLRRRPDHSLRAHMQQQSQMHRAPLPPLRPMRLPRLQLPLLAARPARRPLRARPCAVAQRSPPLDLVPAAWPLDSQRRSCAHRPPNERRGCAKR